MRTNGNCIGSIFASVYQIRLIKSFEAYAGILVGEFFKCFRNDVGETFVGKTITHVVIADIFGFRGNPALFEKIVIQFGCQLFTIRMK